MVVIDVIRAFSTAAYAFASGAAAIYLVAGVDDALALKGTNPGWLAMGEDRGRRPEGFDLPNSPVRASEADLDGRTIVQRTSAGTQGVVTAGRASRLWCAGLVCASATARAVVGARLGDPTFVITGWFQDHADRPGTDDRLTAQHIDRLVFGNQVDDAAVASAVLASDEAARTLLLGHDHVDPRDTLATDVDRFDFAMEVTPTRRACASSGWTRLTYIRPMATGVELVIFDCDGVLVDSERLGVRVEARLITELGWPLTEAEVLDRFVGRSDAYMLGEIETALGRSVPEWPALYQEHLHQAFHDELVPVEGIADALDALTIPSCVASSGTHDKLRLTLGLTGLFARFDGSIFSTTEVANGKPAPDLFLHAADRCGVAPERCVVVEDSRSGVEAARAAGMRALGTRGASPPRHGSKGPTRSCSPRWPTCPPSSKRGAGPPV